MTAVQKSAQTSQSNSIIVFVNVPYQIFNIGCRYWLWLVSYCFCEERRQVFEANEAIAIWVDVFKGIFERNLLSDEPVPELGACILGPSISLCLPVAKGFVSTFHKILLNYILSIFYGLCAIWLIGHLLKFDNRLTQLARWVEGVDLCIDETWTNYEYEHREE